MKTILIPVLAVLLILKSYSAAAQGTAFTYQGRLTTNGAPANGNYDLQFSLFATATGGPPLASALQPGIPVTNGLFTVILDFGSGAFDGGPRWLQIGVRENLSTTILTPRQPITATPYAILAGNISGPLPSGSLAGLYEKEVIFSNSDNGFAGRFAGEGSALSNLNASQLTIGQVPSSALDNAWKTTGNSNTSPGTHFLGTTDNQPLELRVNNRPALRLEPASPAGSINVIAGARQNFVAPGVVGATIAGGGGDSFGFAFYTNSIGADFSTISGGIDNAILSGGRYGFLGAGYSNVLAGEYGVVAGGRENRLAYGASYAGIVSGYQNSIETNAEYSVIGGGDRNQIGAFSQICTISGGSANTIGTNSAVATIAGGSGNHIGTNSPHGTVTGGSGNRIGNNSGEDVIGGGQSNAIFDNNRYGTIAGGYANKIGTNSIYATIGGGGSNQVGTNSPYATIPGGINNYATNYAFAAGNRAAARHSGAFVWADSSNADLLSTNANSVSMRAVGGYRLFSSISGAGAYLAAGSGTWTSLSDRNAKENFEPVDSQAVLEKVAALPVSTWNYKDQTNTVRHMGTMAQDFKAAFGLGESDKGITTVDADGVALAAIQGLNKKVESLETEVAALKELVRKLTAEKQ